MKKHRAASSLKRPQNTAATLAAAPSRWMPALGLIMSLTACSSVAPTSALPELPRAWKNVPSSNTAPSAAARPTAWWRELPDPVLHAWMDLALKRNRDLVRSALRLQQASLQANRTGLDAWPKTSSSLGSSSQQALKSALGNSTTLINGVSVPIDGGLGNKLTTSFNAGLTASYEADLWGRVSQSLTLARQDAALAQADLQTARWLLTTQVAEQYWSLAALDAKAPHLEQAVENAQASLAVTQLRLSLGKGRQGDEHKALINLSEAQLRRAALTTQRDQVLRTMALLLDESPQTFSVPQAHLPAQAPQEPGSWPVASVLDRLAPVQRARIALDQALTRLNIAQSNRYPQLSLSAGLSSSGGQLRAALSNPFSNLGLNLTLPMLDWRRLGWERDGARLGLEIAAMDFRDALFKALAEVDTQYNNRRQWQADAQLQAERIRHAQTALNVAQLRFEQGADALQSVRDAQSTLRELEVSAIDIRLRSWTNQVAIFKAWGGPLDGPAPQRGP